MNDTNNRRQFWRANFKSTVRLTTDHGTVDAKLIDISLKGALLEAPGRWQGKIGDNCHLKLHLAEGVIIAMWGRVAHIEARHVGVFCERLDLDSITHLRRLVELNSGDPALLERELATLLTP